MDSCITIAGLSAGPYTIEATTYAENLTGAFTLTISGLSGTTTTDPDPETDPCAATPITAGTTDGTWTAACRSQVSGRGYARYFTFTLDQQSDVTIDLVSDVDPWLFLREGAARSGDAEYDNDDLVPGTNLNSQITETLAAGPWTIEATTYAAGQPGDLHPHHLRPVGHNHGPAIGPLRRHRHRPPTGKPPATGPPTASPPSPNAATPATSPSPWTSSRTSPST